MQALSLFLNPWPASPSPGCCWGSIHLFLQVLGLSNCAMDIYTCRSIFSPKHRAQMSHHFRSEGVSPTGRGSLDPSSLRKFCIFWGAREPAPRLPRNTSRQGQASPWGERGSCLGGTFPVTTALLSRGCGRTGPLWGAYELLSGRRSHQRDRSRHRTRQGRPADNSQPQSLAVGGQGLLKRPWLSSAEDEKQMWWQIEGQLWVTVSKQLSH